MRIQTIDPGARMGVCFGEAGAPRPRVEAVILRKKGQGVEKMAANLGCYLRDRWTLDRPDLVVIENTDNPMAYRSADAALSQIYCHGALHAMAGIYGVRVESVHSSTYRVHFAGKRSAAPKRDHKRTPAEQRQDREDTNNMIVGRAILLGYLPRDCKDWEKAAAVAMWDWASVHYGRATPASFALTSGTTP